MKHERKDSHQKRVVGIHIDILFYAVRATKPFQVSTIVETVADITTSQAQFYLKALIGLGYIEKVTCYKYQATKFAKDLCGVECIEITRHRNFNIGNAIKYLWRNGLKDSDSQIQDLQKAVWYINDEIKRLESITKRDKEQS